MALEGAQLELSSVQDQLAQARSEIETIKAVATVSENTKQEAIDQVRSQWQEEVASLQAIMKGKREAKRALCGPITLDRHQVCSFIRFCSSVLLRPLRSVSGLGVKLFSCVLSVFPQRQCVSMRSSTTSGWSRSGPSGTSTASQWRGSWGS